MRHVRLLNATCINSPIYIQPQVCVCVCACGLRFSMCKCGGETKKSKHNETCSSSNATSCEGKRDRESKNQSKCKKKVNLLALSPAALSLKAYILTLPVPAQKGRNFKVQRAGKLLTLTCVCKGGERMRDTHRQHFPPPYTVAYVRRRQHVVVRLFVVA